MEQRILLGKLIWLLKLDGQNKDINKLLSQAREDVAITSNLSKRYLS